MSFILTFPTGNGGNESISLQLGEALFVLGANGTGKSSLMQTFSSQAHGRSRRISAHRQTWFQSNAVTYSPSQKKQVEQQSSSFDANPQSRWMEQNPGQRSNITIFDLIDAENVDARSIAELVRSGDIKEAEKLAKKKAPIATINELLRLSNIPIEIFVEGGDQLLASKNGSPRYSVAELSDGERNALLIAADILTAKPGTLLIIDEPERHLHRSIISPLLTQLFKLRDDCAFIVATHDLVLPSDNPKARIMLIRSCKFSGQTTVSWTIDILEPDAEIDDRLRQDIIGARRKVLFIEGEEASLDKPLYRLLFPLVSIRAKGSSREVERAIHGIRTSRELHWLNVWGIIDRDGRDNASVATLATEGIYATPFYSVESIYYHPEFIKKIAERQSAVIGGDPKKKAKEAMEAALAVIRPTVERLSCRSVEKTVRHKVFDGMPNLEAIKAKQPVTININVDELVTAEVKLLSNALDKKDWLYVITRCPIRETQALNMIAKGIGLRDRSQYESAVIQLLQNDVESLTMARNLFNDLWEKIQQA